MVEALVGPHDGPTGAGAGADGGAGAVRAAGRLLRRWREGRGMSQGALALKSGVSKSAVSRWESGLRAPRGYEVSLALEALGLALPDRLAFFALVGDAAAAANEVAAGAGAGRVPTSAPFADAGAGRLLLFGQVLRSAREARGWTQAQVAGRLGVRQGTVSKWEGSRDRPSPAVARALCGLLGIPDGSEEAQLELSGGLAYAPPHGTAGAGAGAGALAGLPFDLSDG